MVCTPVWTGEQAFHDVLRYSANDDPRGPWNAVWFDVLCGFFPCTLLGSIVLYDIWWKFKHNRVREKLSTLRCPTQRTQIQLPELEWIRILNLYIFSSNWHAGLTMFKSCMASHLPYCFSVRYLIPTFFNRNAKVNGQEWLEFLLTTILILSIRSYWKLFKIFLSGISFVVNITLSFFSPEGYPSTIVTHSVSTPPPHYRSPKSAVIEKNHRSPASAYVAPSTPTTSSL